MLSLRTERGIESELHPTDSTSDSANLELAKCKIEAYKKELDELLVYKAECEHARANGFFDSMQERVLHLSDNPYSEKTTGKRLHLQRELGQSLSPLPSGDSPEMSPPGPASQDEIENLKKRIERMKEVFATQTNRFRDAVYQLTGWNVDLSIRDNKVRLRSRYAANRDDYVELIWFALNTAMICRNGADKFEILDTDFVSNLDSHLFAAITVSHSFPVFFGAVTQDLFEKQTVYTGPS